jgi:tRNA(Arg) A34 adenosine deaminase TadA
MENDRAFLKRAVEIASEAIKKGGGPFGAVITKDDKIIAEGRNSVVLFHDPTAHAEIIAIREASAIMKTHDLSGCVIYTSCEPCPMCLGAVYWSGIRKVVYSSTRLDAATAGFNDKFIYDEIALDPAERKISFIHLPDRRGDEVFRKWDEFEDKIPY